MEDRLTFLMPLYACHSLNKLPVLSPVGGFLPSAVSGSCRVEAKCFRCCRGPWSGWLDTGRMGTGKKGQWYQGWPRGEAGCLSTSLEFWSHYWSAFLQLCDTRAERTTLLRKPCVAQSSCSHPSWWVHPPIAFCKNACPRWCAMSIRQTIKKFPAFPEFIGFPSPALVLYWLLLFGVQGTWVCHCCCNPLIYWVLKQCKIILFSKCGSC